MDSDKYQYVLREMTEQIIQNDGRTLEFLIKNINRNGTMALIFLPYMALYCREAQEFYHVIVIDEEIDKQIKDLRDGVKILCGKYNKMTKTFLETDNEQDEEFKNKLKFGFMRKLNIHKNLGVYFDKSGHMIGNTHLLNEFLNMVEMKGLGKPQKSFKIGNSLGKSVSRIQALSKLRKIVGIDFYKTKFLLAI